MKKFLYLPAEAVCLPTVASFLRDYPVEIDDTGILCFDLSSAISSDSLEVIKSRLNDDNLSYDICILEEFPTIIYSRPDGEKKVSGFIRKRDIQNLLERDISDAEKLALIRKMVSIEKVESIGDIVRRKKSSCSKYL